MRVMPIEAACYHRFVIAYSGGLDSTVLLHYLSKDPAIFSKLQAIHIHHGLSPNASVWQRNAEQQCQDLGVAFSSVQLALTSQGNVEEMAREARYKALSAFIQPGDCLLTAHHGDDQAETLLLQLFRGAGIEGMAAMEPISPFGQGVLIRPLLICSRQELEAYARAHQLSWIDDESNLDVRFSRNFIRQQLMPLIKTRWPQAMASLQRTAAHCQAAKENLADLALLDCPDLKTPSNKLALDPLKQLSRERLANVLRVWLRFNQVKPPNTNTFNRLLDELIEARTDAIPAVTWGHQAVRRYRQALYLCPHPARQLPAEINWSTFPQPLMWQGTKLAEAKPSTVGLCIPPGSTLTIRFRQGGETFSWHGQTKQVKHLMQQWAIPPWLRGEIPLLYIDDQLACIIGYAMSDCFYHDDDAGLFEIV